MIQYLNESSGLEMSTVFSPLERLFFNPAYHGQLALPRGEGKYGCRVFSKGLTSSQIARGLRESYDMFDDPVVPSMDCSKFDKTVGELLMLKKFDFYACLLDADAADKMSQYLELYLHPWCRSKIGYSYKPNSQLWSGAFDTSLTGNVCMLLIYSALRRALNGDLCPKGLLDAIPSIAGPPLKSHDMMVKINGDDCLVILERETYQRFASSVEPFFALFGLNVRVDGVANSFEEVQWCQHRPVRCGDRWRMVRQPEKVFLTTAAGTKFVSESVQSQKDFLYTVGYCELLLNPGVPVIQEYAAMCMRVAVGGHINYDQLRENHRVAVEEKAGNTPHEESISYSARLSFEQAWGLNPLAQYDLECAFKRFSVDWSGATFREVFDCDKWSFETPSFFAQGPVF
jgi:hypothetical protein